MRLAVYSISVLSMLVKKFTILVRYSLATDVLALVGSSSIALISDFIGAAASPAHGITCRNACANLRSMLANRSPPQSPTVAGDVFGSKASLHHFVHTSRSRSQLACITNRTTCFQLQMSLIFGQGGTVTFTSSFLGGNFDDDDDISDSGCCGSAAFCIGMPCFGLLVLGAHSLRPDTISCIQPSTLPRSWFAWSSSLRVASSSDPSLLTSASSWLRGGELPVTACDDLPRRPSA